MTAAARPRRSVLYVPASNARALAKAPSVGADAVILDLEDAVAPAAKPAARAAAAEAVARSFGGAEVAVRVNGLETPWGRDDLIAVAAARPDAVVLPKVESADAVRWAGAILAESGAPLPLWVTLETPRGVLRADEIAAAPGVAALVLGTSDLARDLGARHTPDRLPLLTSLGLCLLAARAYGLVALDGVHLQLDDDAGFEEACRQGRALGFDGKTLIHPRTVPVANRVFAPDAAEVDAARRVIEAYEAAVAAGQGVAVVDGRLVERLHVDAARRLVALDAACRARDAREGSP